MANPIDIGHGLSIRFWEYPNDPTHQRAGFTLWHGEECVGGVLFDVPIAREREPGKVGWTVESWEPLTISPSILCYGSGLHGWIRDGRWVPA